MGRLTWVERRRRQRRSWLRRRFEHSFGLRLLVALLAALASVAVVNRWENCRDRGLTTSCLLHDAGGVMTVGNLEAISIMTAGFLFILEGGQRRQHLNVEAMELIHSCQQAGVRFSHARNEALELLCEAGVPMDGLNLSGSDLDELHVPGVSWRQADLSGSSLRDADLRRADLSGANLRNADLTGALLTGAVLTDADLSGTILSPDAVPDPDGR